MDPSIFHIEPDFHVSYDPEVPCVVMVWRGYHDSASFRARNEQVLAVLAEHRASQLLCDIRHFILIGATDQEWLNAAWLPRAMAAGLRTCAIVTPVFYFNRVAVQSVVERIVNLTLRVEHFDSLEMARSWLQQTRAGC